MDNLLLQIGVGGAIAILIIKEVLAFVKALMDKRSGGGNGAQHQDKTMEYMKECAMAMRVSASEIHDLHTWHSARGSDGNFVWYSDTRLGDALQNLSDNIGAQTEVLRDMAAMLLRQNDATGRIERRLEEK